MTRCTSMDKSRGTKPATTEQTAQTLSRRRYSVEQKQTLDDHTADKLQLQAMSIYLRTCWYKCYL